MPYIKRFFPVCTLLWTAIAVASDVPQPTLTLTVVAHCPGICYPRIVPLRDSAKAIILWVGQDSLPWAQTADLRAGQLLGTPVLLGTPSAAPGPLYQPVPVALPGGDLALVDVLRDGRITVTRGSETPARRSPPKVVGVANGLEVLGLAAAPAGDGVAILVLRGPHSEDRRQPRKSIDYEMMWLDPAGREMHPPVAWKGDAGFAPRLATCGDRQYLAWLSNRGLVTSTFSSKFERSTARVFPFAKGVATDSGPLLCTESGARLFTAWTNDPTGLELNALVAVADLTPNAGVKAAWHTIKLPDPPYTDRGWLDLQQTAAGTQLVAKRAAKARLLTITDSHTTASFPLPPNQACVATPDGQHAVCTEMEQRSTEAGRCPQYETAIKLRWYGAPVTGEKARGSFDYWATGSISDAGAPAAWEIARERSLLRCGTPEFDQLREALNAWCTNPKEKPSVDQGYLAYCDRSEPKSLLSQATSCKLEPTRCGTDTVDNAPSVDRATFERGKRVELNYLNCSVWFSRSTKGWRVVDRECDGD